MSELFKRKLELLFYGLGQCLTYSSTITFLKFPVYSVNSDLNFNT